MKNLALNPSRIATTKFRIPLYQRPYAWSTSQVEQLLNDLHKAYLGNQNSDYHIGILSVAATQDDKECFDLIDGQQRITTLMLIGKAAKAYWKGWNAFLETHRLHLYGRTGDQAYLDGDDFSRCNPLMLAAVHTAEEFMKERGSQEFARYIHEHAAFFLSEVPLNYSLLDKNQQFVRMNNRGKQLEKHEILKVRLLSKINDVLIRIDAFKIWNTMVDRLTGLLPEENDAQLELADILTPQGRISGPAAGTEPPAGTEPLYRAIVTVPEFLLIALARILKQTERNDGFFNTDRLLETFEILIDEDSILAFVRTLAEQVNILCSCFIFLSIGGKYDLGVGPDAAEVDLRLGDDIRLKNCLIAVQSFLYVSTLPHHWLIPAFDWCAEHTGPKMEPESFIAELEAIDNHLIHERKRKLSSINDLDVMTYGKVSHYWFYRLDYELWKQYDQPSADNNVWASLPREQGATGGVQTLLRTFRFRHCGSVEHIKPQKNPVDGTGYENSDHSFGNLALISASRNSQFSNNLSEGKKALILQSETPYIESLKMLHFLWCNFDSESAGKCMHGILWGAVKDSLPKTQLEKAT